MPGWAGQISGEHRSPTDWKSSVPPAILAVPVRILEKACGLPSERNVGRHSSFTEFNRMTNSELLQAYLAGPRLLRSATAGLTAEQARQRPVAGRWSTLEVVAHLADFEPIYADRMKRVLAEDRPAMMSGNPDLFASRLAYHSRDLEEELRLIETVRGQVARILGQIAPADWDRVGLHSTDGAISLRTLLERVTGHITHHLPFLAEKRQALGLS
jgi:uncharacterized damage-inducible protein DinB